jgi:hypothetical protein
MFLFLFYLTYDYNRFYPLVATSFLTLGERRGESELLFYLPPFLASTPLLASFLPPKGEKERRLGDWGQKEG